MKEHIQKLIRLKNRVKASFLGAKKLRDLFSNDMAIDLGTANTVVYIPSKGIVLDEPSVVAVKSSDNSVLAAGIQAKQMLGRTPDTIVACRPLRDGVIANFELAESMLSYFIAKVPSDKRVLVKPRMIIAVPSGITQVERRAVIDSAYQAGARIAKTIIEPMAAAIGADLPVDQACASLIVDIGGGTVETAVISLKSVVFCRSVRVGGDEMDRAIVSFIKRTYNVLIGERTAEDVKINIGCALLTPELEDMTHEIKGRDLITGVPRMVTISAAEVQQALSETVKAIVDVVKLALENTPPELSSDLVDRGVTLAGGGAQLKGLDMLIAKETGLPVRVADNPLFCVVRGVGKVLENYSEYEDALQ
jgi:rod shape-determining protein MreB and related proteins